MGFSGEIQLPPLTSLYLRRDLDLPIINTGAVDGLVQTLLDIKDHIPGREQTRSFRSVLLAVQRTQRDMDQALSNIGSRWFSFLLVFCKKKQRLKAREKHIQKYALNK